MSEWLAYIETHHAVNPWVFAFLYCVPHVLVFYGALFQAVRQFRAGRREAAWTAFLVALAGYVSPYVYVQAVGRNLPTWIQAIVIGLIVMSVVTASHQLSRRLRA